MIPVVVGMMATSLLWRGAKVSCAMPGNKFPFKVGKWMFVIFCGPNVNPEEMKTYLITPLVLTKRIT